MHDVAMMNTVTKGRILALVVLSVTPHLYALEMHTLGEISLKTGPTNHESILGTSPDKPERVRPTLTLDRRLVFYFVRASRSSSRCCVLSQACE